MNLLISENYLDPDVAYLLGLIIARGTLYESSGDKKIIIDFPFKNLEAEGIHKKYNQKEHLNYSLLQIKERISELIETDISVDSQEHSASLIIRFLRNSLPWRNICHLLGKGKTHFSEFLIPEQVFTAPRETQREFIRGIADSAGFIRESNNYMGNKRRVYLEIANKNWLLPVQLCALLQQELHVSVQLIQWGHPNTREPYELKRGTSWAREHQVKIFSEAFLPIGFYVKYKQEILEEFAKDDLDKPGSILPCNPNPKVRRHQPKPKHPAEKSKLLPFKLRGKHFDNYWGICLCLGCKQKSKIYNPQMRFIEDEDVTSEPPR